MPLAPQMTGKRPNDTRPEPGQLPKINEMRETGSALLRRDGRHRQQRAIVENPRQETRAQPTHIQTCPHLEMARILTSQKQMSVTAQDTSLPSQT